MDDGVTALATNQKFSSLVSLNLESNRIGAHGVQALAASDNFPQLEATFSYE